MSPLVIVGASGFVGRYLLTALPVGQFDEVRLLVHRERAPETPVALPVVRVAGDLLDPASLKGLIAEGSTVIHLASPRRPQENIAAARNLLAACHNAGIARLVHCSTAVVVGRVPDNVITEVTPCYPFTAYEHAKYRIEREIQEAAGGRHEIVILRPTSVFGPGGQNLVAFARRIQSGSEAVNLAYALLEGRRRMNLVSVHNVAAALLFVATLRGTIGHQVYIASDDEAPANNFRGIEQILRRILGRERAAPTFSMPPPLLSAVLRARGRSNTNPMRTYSDAKLRALGFVRPWAFESAVTEFARWYHAQAGAPVEADHAGA